MERTNNILAVIVTYNRKELLAECLDALEKQSFSVFDILVLNNASSDGTNEFLSGKTSERIKVLSLPENIGGAGGFYEGIKFGTENGYKYLWLMDDDTVPEINSLETLIKAGELLNDNYGFLSSLALFTDGTPCVMNNHLLPSKITTDCLKVVGEETYYKVLTATFVSLLIKTETVKKVGLPVKEMFIWSDDTEYTSRITKAEVGYFVPQSIVVHKMKENLSPDLAVLSEDRLGRMVLNIRNRYFIARRDGFKKKLRFYARHAKLFFRTLKNAKDNKCKRLRVIFKGIWQGWKFKPKISVWNNGKFE